MGRSQAKTAYLGDLELTCNGGGRGRLLFGDAHGWVYVLRPTLKDAVPFEAFDGAVHQVWQASQQDVLVTVGDDEDQEYLVKLWSLDQPYQVNRGRPVLLKQFPAFSGSPPCPITTICASSNMRFLALGLENGTVMSFGGDVVGAKADIKLLEVPDAASAVTGLALDEKADTGGRAEGRVLYVTTAETVVSYRIDSTMAETPLADVGTGPGLATVAPGRGVVVAYASAQKGIEFYQPESHGDYFHFDEAKKMVAWHNGNLVVVFTVSPPGGKEKVDVLNVYDLENRLLVYSEELPSPVERLFCEFGSIFAHLNDGRLLRLTEKDVRLKLALLFRKHMYSLAADVAKFAKADEEVVADVHRQWADHLYDKGDLEGAMEQYLNGVRYLEPSHVIQKYLDSAHVALLARYLEALHTVDLAESGHTTLMLNCFTRMKDKSRLEAILSNDQIDFSVEKAITACVRAGFIDTALDLAKNQQEHHMYIEIQTQKRHAYREALEYIWQLPFDEAEKAVERNGKVLATALPDETTALLKSLCTGYVPREKDDPTTGRKVRRGSLTQVPVADDAAPRSNADKYLFIFSGSPESLMNFLETVVLDAKNHNRTHALPPSVYNTLLELYLQEGSRVKHMKQTFLVAAPSPLVAGGYRTNYVTSNFLAETGYERDEVTDCDFSLYQAASGDGVEEQEIEQKFAQGMRDGVSVHSRMMQERKDGSERAVFVSAIPLKDRDAVTDTVTNYVVIFSEMPAEMLDDDESGIDVDTVMSRLAERVVLVDPQGNKVVNVSQEFGLSILGGSTKRVNNLIGKDYTSDLSNQMSETPEQKLEVARLREGMRRRTQCSNVRLERNPDRADVLGGDVQLVHACPLKDAAGNTPLFVCVHCDISDEDRALRKMIVDAASSRDDGAEAMDKAAQVGPLTLAAVSRRKKYRMRVKEILEDSSARYKEDHMLILCQQHNYSAGMLFLLQKLDFHDTILDYYMLYNQYEKVISFANEFGDEDPSLWTKVVQFMASGGEGLETSEQRAERERHLSTVLEMVEEKKALSALSVVQLLGSSAATCSVGVAKDFLIKTFQSLADEKAMSEGTIDVLRKETESIRKETEKGHLKIEGATAEAVRKQIERAEARGAPEELHTVRQTSSCYPGLFLPTSLQKALREPLLRCCEFRLTCCWLLSAQSFTEALQSKDVGMGSAERFKVVVDHFGLGLFEGRSGGAHRGRAAAPVDDY